MGNASERITESVFCEGEVRHVPEGGDGTFGQDPEGGTTSVACEVETTKPGHLDFDQVDMSTINWRPTGGKYQNILDPTEASQF